MKRLGKLDVMTQSLSHGGDWKDHEIKGSLGYIVRLPFKTERTNKISVKVTQPLVNSGLHPYPFMRHFLKDLLTCVSVYECVQKSAGHGSAHTHGSQDAVTGVLIYHHAFSSEAGSL